MIIRSIAAIVAVCVVTPVPAIASPDTTKVTIRHTDLDLSTRAGIARLDRRIARGARQACGYESPADLAGKVMLHRCRRDAIASVQTQRAMLLEPQALAAR